MHTVKRAALVAAIGQPCPYCGEPMGEGREPSRDHIHPYAKGGRLDRPENRAIVCHPCNSDKGAKTLNQWRQHLGRAGDPRAVCVEAFIGRLIAPTPPR